MSDAGEEEENQEFESDQEDFEEQIPTDEMQIDILKEKLREGLSVIGKTVEGDGWAFTKLECEARNVQNLYEVMLGYPYLREINFSKNKIAETQTISQIKYLINLNLAENNITDFAAFAQPGQLQFLETLNLSENQLKSLDHFELKNLKTLILDKNEIASGENFKGHAKLQTLSLTKNKLKNLKDLKNMPSLTKLTVTNNPVTEFSGLENTNALKEINLKLTNIEDFKEEDLPELQYLNNLNLDDCKKFANLKAIDLLIKYEKSLNIISVNGTQLAEEVGDSVKKEILMKLPKLKSINEEPVEAEEVEAALQEKKDREEAEKARLAEEAEAARLAEEEKRLAEEEAKNKEAEGGEEDQE